MKVGYSRICINPPYGAPIIGYYQSRFVKGIADNLYCRAVAFDDGENKAVVIALDICLFEKEYYDAMKRTIAATTGLAEEAIFINCSHTHTGPLVGKDFASEEESTKAYDEFLISSVRDAAIYAFNDLSEAKFEAAETEAKNISFVRRFSMKDGSVATNPGVNNENIDHPLGVPNETVKLIKIIRENNDNIFMVNFGTHPDSVGGEYISADYMGHMCSILENALPDTKCIFLLGVQGDVNHVNVHPTDAESRISVIDFDNVPRSRQLAEHMGRILAGAVLSICSVTEEVKCDKISFATKMVNLPSNQENHRIPEMKKIYEYYEAGRADELPYEGMELTTVVAEASRILSLEHGPEFFTFTLSAIKLGELVFAGIGGEPFTEIGNRICQNSPFKNTILCCLTNNSGGYIPTSKAYDEGGYEARGAMLKRGSDDILVNGMTELLKRL